jgi:iron complex transport system substrate-binding protein
VVTRLVVLATSVGAIVGVVSAYVPSDLIAPAQRPFAGYGSAAIRMESAAYPRHAVGADDVRVTVDRVTRRIVSQDSHAEEFLYRIVPADRVIGVSESAYERRVSNVLELVERHHPIIATDIERVLLAHPDLVFSPMSAVSDQVNLLRHAGIPVYRLFTMFETLEEVADHIALIGYLTGEDARAAAEIGRFLSTIDAAVSRRKREAAPPRVLGLGGSYTYGRRTLFTDILRRLGAENVAATHGVIGYDGVTDELIVRWDPEWVIAAGERGRLEQVREELLNRPAIAATRAGVLGQVAVFEYQVFLPLSPFTAALVDGLADVLDGGQR